MKAARLLLRFLLALGLALPASCVTSQASFSRSGEHPAQPTEVRVTQLPGDQLQLDFEPLPPDLALELLSEEEARMVLAAFSQAFSEASQFQVLPARNPPTGAPALWERQLRAEFLGRYGPSRLPLPESLQHSPLFMALKLSPRYMGQGIREAAREMFRSPVFVASVALSVLVYFAAWALPEPIFSKAFAATLTVRLAMVVGLLELRNIALALLQLYKEANSARTMKELEAVAERFGHALGGTALRVLVMVASFGVARGVPNVPPGGMGALLNPPRYAMAGGISFQSASTAQIVGDGTIVWHHLATNKNDSSSLRGGPWTPRFKRLFDKAGLSLGDPANLVYLAGHLGPHSEGYHTEVYRRLEAALEDCRPLSLCRVRLVEELRQLRREVCTPGSPLHRFLTKP